uniref:Uncharacterized protein n=1 Tax=Cyclopterus lumpus TaxID=8103 RepID=A0A8C3G597_CYCLU
MDTIFATLACCLLLIPFAVAQTQEEQSTVGPTIPSPDINTTHTTATTLPSANSTGHIAVITNSTESTTPFTATTQKNNETSADATAATSESTSRLQTSQSTANVTPQTNGTSPTTATHGTPTATALTTTQTTVGYISTALTFVSFFFSLALQDLRLNISEKNMTIVFSVVLGVFAVAVVVFMLHKCKHKIQYLHQPLNNTGDAGKVFPFVMHSVHIRSYDDTLVISGGLYDGHPIYDNVPTAPEDQSQFRLHPTSISHSFHRS